MYRKLAIETLIEEIQQVYLEENRDEFQVESFVFFGTTAHSGVLTGGLTQDVF